MILLLLLSVILLVIECNFLKLAHILCLLDPGRCLTTFASPVASLARLAVPIWSVLVFFASGDSALCGHLCLLLVPRGLRLVTRLALPLRMASAPKSFCAG